MADRLGVPNTQLTRLTPMLRPLALAREIARASHLLGSDERIARFELAFVERIDGDAGRDRRDDRSARGGPRAGALGWLA